jgi:signal transduction histidine kinase
MSSARPERLFDSTSFRLSAAYAALILIAFAVTAVIAWAATKEAAEREVRERISLEMNALQEEMVIESMDAAMLDMRSHLSEPGALEYRLVDASGRLILGNLDVAQPTEGWGKARIYDTREGENKAEDFLTLTKVNPDGSILTIGDDLDKAEGVRSAVLRALFWVAAPTLILVIGAGTLLAYSNTRRMRALSRAMAEVGEGSLSTRAPDKGSDEIARIGAGVNDMVARIDTLVLNIRRVSTDIAHDLRTPLAHVRQDLETAASSADPATRDAIRGAQSRIDDVLRVFQAIMRLAEIDADAGGVRKRFAPIDLSGIVERVTDAYRPDIEASGRTLVVEGLETSHVTGDQDLVTLCLANLLENAMKHTPPATAIQVAIRKSGGRTTLIVEDQGAGIPEEDRARVLEPFVRLDASRSTPGAGLGLSIVSAIARLHGAVLSIASAEPGLRLSISWPDER